MAKGRIVRHNETGKTGYASYDQKPVTNKIFVNWDDGTKTLVSIFNVVFIGYFD